jgi:uncharacterized OB-fold protein
MPVSSDSAANNYSAPAFSGPGPVQVYQDALARGLFLLQHCQDCGKYLFYPRVLCNHCGGISLTWVQPSGRGVVYSSSVVRQKPEKGGEYNVALIELEEGPRLLSRVTDRAPDAVKIGMHVSARIGSIDGQPALVFHGGAAERGE